MLDGDELLERHGRRRYNSKLPRNSSRAIIRLVKWRSGA